MAFSYTSHLKQVIVPSHRVVVRMKEDGYESSLEYRAWPRARRKGTGAVIAVEGVLYCLKDEGCEALCML